MPRLHVWLAGATATAGASYVGYYHVYCPRVERQERLEQRLARDLAAPKEALQAYAALLKSVEDKRRALQVHGYGTANGDTAAVSHLFTNAERLELYLGAQRVKALLYALPPQAQTAAEKRYMLSQLDRLVSRECGGLNCRPAPPSWAQAAASCIGCCVYLAWFRGLAALLSVIMAAPPFGFQRRDSPGGVRATPPLVASANHLVASFILGLLGITAVMTLEAPDGAATDASQPSSPAAEVLLLHAHHWLEEVAFWACSNNPALAGAKQDADHGKAASTAVCVLRGVSGSSRGSDDNNENSGGNGSRASSAARGALQSYEAFWAAWERQKHVFTDSDAPQSKGRKYPGGWVRTFGYPAAAAAAASSNFTGVTDGSHETNEKDPLPVSVRPVVAAGTPLFVYMGAAAAVPDEAPRLNARNVYKYVQRLQFPNDRRRREMSSSSGDGRPETKAASISSSTSFSGDNDDTAAAEMEGCAPLRGLPHSVSPLSRAYWSGVAGPAGGGNRRQQQQRVLHLRVGAGSRASELARATIETQARVTQLAYAEL